MPQQQSALARFRDQYPMYSDLSDAEIADRLYERHYSDMDRADFDARIMPTGGADPVETPGDQRMAGVFAGMAPAVMAVRNAITLNPDEAQAEQSSRIRDRELDLAGRQARLDQVEGMSEAERILASQSPAALIRARSMGMSAEEYVSRMDPRDMNDDLLRIARNYRDREAARLDRAENAGLPEYRPEVDMVARPIQGAGTAIGSMIEGAGWLQSEAESAAQAIGLGDGNVRAPSETELGRLGAQVREGVRNNLPTDAARDDDFANQLGEAPGQIAAFAGPGGLARAAIGARVGTAATSGLGALAGSGEGVSDARQYGATPEQERIAGRVGAAAGSLEALGGGSGMVRGVRGVGGRVVRGIRQGGTEALQEGAQEGVQTASQNLTARATYDPERAPGEGVLRSMAIGGLAGGAFGAATGAASNPAASPDAIDLESMIAEMSDEDLAARRQEVAADIARRWEDGRETGTSAAERGAALGEHSQALEAMNVEADRRGLGERVSPEISQQPAIEPAADIEPEMTDQSTPADMAREDLLPEGLVSLDPRELQVDAETFQFKTGGDSDGVTDRLSSVTQWDPSKANVTMVYEDREGRRFIADGHQRRALAMRLIEQDPSQAGRIRLIAKVYREADGHTPQDVRGYAASKNLAEGTGTAIDAAKVMRETPQFIDESVPRGAIMSQAEGLSRLNDEAFGAVVNEVVPANQGAIVGRLVEDPAQQMAVIDVLARTRPASAFEAEVQVRDVLNAGFQEQKTGSLFGDEILTQSLIAERSKVLAAANRMIRNNRRVFSTLTREADSIETAGNSLARDVNAKKAQDNAQLEQILQRLATRQGPISDALNAGARSLADGRRIGDVAREFTGAVEGLLAQGGIRGIEGSRAPGGNEQSDAPGADVAQQKRELVELLSSTSDPEAIQSFPLVRSALDEMSSIQSTAELYDFSSEDYNTSRPFLAPQSAGKDLALTGVAPLLAHHFDHAKKFAWTDDGMTAPASPVQFRKEITFVIGYPAAGKSSVANPSARHLEAAILDADELKKSIPEYGSGVGAAATHQESSYLTGRLYELMLETGVNIVWPKVGNNPKQIASLIDQAKAAGYTANLIWMDTAKNEAMRRMIGRFVSTGRIIPPSVLDIDRIEFQRSYDYLVGAGVVANAVRIDGNQPREVGALVVEDKGGILNGSEIRRQEVAGGRAQGRGAGAQSQRRGQEGQPRRPGGPTQEGLLGRVKRTGGLAAPSLELGNVPAVPRGSAEVATQTLREISDELIKRLRIPAVRAGRMSARGAEGQFYSRDGVIRLKRGADFSTLVHEIGHSLAFTHRPAFDAVAEAAGPELVALAAGVESNPDTVLDEGFAELVRTYITNPAYIQRKAPRAVAAFEREYTAAAPEMLEAVQDAQRAHQSLIHSPSGENIAADTVQTRDGRGVAATIKKISDVSEAGAAAGRFVDRLYSARIDKINPILLAQRRLDDIYEANTGRRLSLKPTQNAYMLARLATNAKSAGHMDIMHGVTPYGAADPEGPGLADALEVAFRDQPGGGIQKWDERAIRQFDAYLISRRSVQEWRRFDDGEIPNAPDKFSRADHETNLEELEKSFPAFREAAEMIYAWNNALLAKKRDAGLLTDQQYRDFTTQHPDYVPFLRDMSESRDSVGGAVSATNKDNRVRQFRGSDRAIISPIESMARDAYMTASAIARNDMIGALASMADRAGLGSGEVIEEVPDTEIQGRRVDAREALKSAAREAGILERDAASLVEAMDQALDGQTFGTIYNRVAAKEGGEPMIYHWQNGKRRMLRLADGEMGREMFNAITALGAENMDGVLQVLSVASSVMRYGITTDPAFLLANYVRDQVSAWILTDEGFVPGIDGLKGMAAELAQGDTSRRYNSAGGIMGGANVAAVRDSAVEADLQALRKKGYQARRFASWKGFAALTEISETGTRLGLFERAFRNAKKQGMADKDAMIHAAFIAQDYIDFGRHGSRMIAARRIFTFLNASLQGLDKTRRVLSGGSSLRRILRPLFGKRANLNAQERADLRLAGKAWVKVALIGAMGMALAALYEDDPEYAEISEYLRATHWAAKVNGEWVFIPKPFELAFLSNIMERGYEAHAHQDPNAIKRMRRGLLQLVVPPLENPLLTVPRELWANKSTFNDREVVPSYMEGLEPAEQFNAYTSAFSRSLGRQIGVSPMQIDHVITGFGGSWGRSILDGADLILQDGSRAPAGAIEDMWVMRRFFKDPMRGAQSSADFWDQMNRTGGRLEEVSATYREIASSGRTDQAVAYILQRTPLERDFALLRNHFPPAQKRLHPMLRASDAMRVGSEMMRELDQGALRQAGSEEVIPLTRAQAREAVSTLRQINVLEAQDALNMTGFAGYQERPRLARRDLMAQLRQISPEVARQYDLRLVSANVTPIDLVRDAWPRLSRSMRRFDTPGEIDPLARMSRVNELMGEM